MKKLIFFLLGFSLIANADRSEDLFAENQKSKSYIKSFYMDCSTASPLCIEREEALRAERRFNNIFETALSRNIHNWPNNEMLRVEETLELRKIADNSFKDQFFGNASDSYKEATKAIFEILKEADLTVKELLELGEEYLYQDGKPDWAAPYFNDAVPYDPENQRIIDGLSRIKFLRSFEDDIKTIENLILMADYQKALVLINETMRGDPGNKTLQELRARATEELKAAEINFLLFELNSESYDLSLDEKKEKLTKIQNSISLYGEEALGEDIQSSKRQLEDLIYTEELLELKEVYVHNPNEIEIIYQRAKDLSRNYPKEKGALDFLRLVKESRDKLRLDELKTTADKLRASELWAKAENALQEIYIIEQSEEVWKQISDVENIISLLSQIKEIQDNSYSGLSDSQDYINYSKSLSKELKVYSNESTPKLNKNLIEFDSLINQHQILITKEAKGKKTQKSSISKPFGLITKDLQVVEGSSNKKPSKIDYASARFGKRPSKSKQPTASFQKASLIKSSFAKGIYCKRRVNNKKFTAYFQIIVSSTGKAKEVSLVDAHEFESSNSSLKNALEITRKALYKSKYHPAQKEGVDVESLLKQKLVIPAKLCSR